MKTSELAYCAGVIDSDGTIGIKRSTYAMRVTKDCAQAVFSERVSVKQVERAAVDLLHNLFGGYRTTERASTARGKPLEVWQATDLRAIACIAAVHKFLRIKKRQAENCLALRKIKNKSKKDRVSRGRGHVGSAARKEEYTQQMEALHAIAHQLNRVGA